MNDREIVDGLAQILADLEVRMEALQADLSPMGDAPVAPKPALQQLDYVTQALGDLARLCSASSELTRWATAIEDRTVIKLERIRQGFGSPSDVERQTMDESGALTLF